MESYYIIHSGIKGMKWGVRRYQNEDGTLTDLGKKRYSKSESKRLLREEIKNAAREGTKLKLARSDLDKLNSKIEKTSGKKQTKLEAKRELLKSYIENQRMSNDFAIKNAERVRDFLADEYGGKRKKIPMEVVKSGERYVKDKSGLLTWLGGAIGGGIEGAMRVSEYKKDRASYEQIKRQGTPDTDWKRLYRDYDLEYPYNAK